MRSRIKLNTVNYDEFVVNDSSGGLVTGLTNGDFTKYLYNPAGAEVSSSVTVTVVELGNGLYRVNFTPNQLGEWVLSVVNSTHFAYSKSSNYLCVEYYVDDIEVLIRRILGLTQENFRVADSTYDANHALTSAKIKIYGSKADTDNDVNSIATYSMTATYNAEAEMTSYKVTKD